MPKCKWGGNAKNEQIQKDNRSCIATVIFYPVKVRLSRVSLYLQQVEQGKLKELGISEKNGATMAVPFGRVTDNALLGNIGPDIPIHLLASYLN